MKYLDKYNLSEQEKKELKRHIISLMDDAFRKGYSAAVRDGERGQLAPHIWGEKEEKKSCKNSIATGSNGNLSATLSLAAESDPTSAMKELNSLVSKGLHSSSLQV